MAAMTELPPPVPSGPSRSSAESMSLLVDLVTNSLEPEYAAATARQEARRDAAAPASGRRRNLLALSAALAGLAAVGVLLGLGARRAQSDAPVDRRAHDKLADQVRSAAATVDGLAKSAAQLRTDADRLRAQALSNDDQGAGARLAEAEQASASVAVAGPGVRIVVDDAPVAAGAEQDPAARVSDRDLQRIVNALWSSGAEAIAVSGVRLTARSSIRTAGEAILVDFRPVTLPYTVEAIGDPAVLPPTFAGTPEAAEMRSLVATYGIRYAVTSVEQVTLPAGAGLEPRLASPLPSTGEPPSSGPTEPSGGSSP
ncbi:MAG: Membrane associated protein [Frankiales bacterium]|nr:Membrane associated protein [Frankiales bacterium]